MKSLYSLFASMLFCSLLSASTELHLHLGGAWPLEFLREVAQPEDFRQLTAALQQIENGVNYHEVFHVFGLTAKIVNSEERVEQGTAALCQKLAQEGVTYAEFRTGLKNLGHGYEGYLNAVLRGIRQGEAKNPIKIGLVLSLRRDTSAQAAEQTIDLALQYRAQGIVGLDISGDSVQGDGSAIFPALLRGKAQGLPLTLHIGESPKETPEQQMLELSTLQPERLGHCVHLCPPAQAWIRENTPLVELCLTSAVKTGMITQPQDHPALSLLLQGHPVAICTDDPLIFNTTLAQECRYVSQVSGLSLEEVHATQQKIGAYAFKEIPLDDSNE